jgi:predicted RNA binding protein YcfA (HicA-like mRNA interferase family)
MGLAPWSEVQPQTGRLAAECLVKIRDVLKKLEEDGWSVVRQRVSHRQLKHPTQPGLVTVAGQPGDDVAPGTLNSILKQAGLKP